MHPDTSLEVIASSKEHAFTHTCSKGTFFLSPLPVFPQSSDLEPISSSDLTFNWFLSTFYAPFLPFFFIRKIKLDEHMTKKNTESQFVLCFSILSFPFPHSLNSGLLGLAQCSFQLFLFLLEVKRGSCWAPHLLRRQHGFPSWKSYGDVLPSIPQCWIYCFTSASYL